MSDLPADMCVAISDVCFGPIVDIRVDYYPKEKNPGTLPEAFWIRELASSEFIAQTCANNIYVDVIPIISNRKCRKIIRVSGRDRGLTRQPIE
jgi:hypothetical protein